MPTQGASSPYDVGTHHSLRRSFGSFPIAPLLRALADELPQGSYLRLITIIDPYMRKFMKSRGLAVWRFPWRRDADLQVAHGDKDFAGLLAVAEAHQSRQLGVWFHAYDPTGSLILEAEDGHDYLWLADSLPPATHEHLVRAVGGALSRIDGVSSTFSAWGGP